MDIKINTATVKNALRHLGLHNDYYKKPDQIQYGSEEFDCYIDDLQVDVDGVFGAWEGGSTFQQVSYYQILKALYEMRLLNDQVYEIAPTFGALWMIDWTLKRSWSYEIDLESEKKDDHKGLVPEEGWKFVEAYMIMNYVGRKAVREAIAKVNSQREV